MNGRDGPETPTVELLESTTAYSGFFRLRRYRLRHRLFAGGMSGPIERERLERSDSVIVLPYDPVRDELVMLEQFRIGALEHPLGPWMVELVAGLIEPGESLEAVARREALEEAGLELRALQSVCDYLVNPGNSAERSHLFCAWVDSAAVGGIHGLPHEGEDIRVSSVPFEQAWSWLEQGRIASAGPIIALQWLRANREGLRKRWR